MKNHLRKSEEKPYGGWHPPPPLVRPRVKSSKGLYTATVANLHCIISFDIKLKYYVLFQKRVRVFHHDFQTRENI